MGLLDDAIREHLDLKRRRGADPAEIEKAEREALGPVRREASATALGELEPPAGLMGDLPGAVSEDFEFVETDAAADESILLSDKPGPVLDPDGLPPAVAPPAADQPYLDDFESTEPVVADEFDLPGEGPIAAMPPEPEHKPKRRHLFHFRNHGHDDVFEDEARSLPTELPDDDPFAEEAVDFAPPPLAPEPPAAAEPPRETGGGEAVGRAQPIQRDTPPVDETTFTPPPATDARPSTPPPPAPPQPPALRIGGEGELGRTVEYDVEEAFAEEDKAGEPAEEDILEETPDFLADTPDHDRLWFEQKPPPDFDFEN